MNKTAEQHLVSHELKKIVDKCPIAIRDQLEYIDYNTNQTYLLKGLSKKIPYRKMGQGHLIDELGFSEYGIGLSADCDNMPETLLHEACHIYRAMNHIDRKDRELDEREVEFMTAEYFSFPDVRNKMVSRTIEVLGEKGY